MEKIANQTHTLWAYRDYWRGLVEMTQANDSIPPSTFFDALGIWYADEQTVAVRRQLDRDRRTVSLWRLIHEIAKHPEVMTRERHLSLWGHEHHWRELGNANYDKFAGEDHDTISPERTLEDRARLEAIGEHRSRGMSINGWRIVTNKRWPRCRPIKT